MAPTISNENARKAAADFQREQKRRDAERRKEEAAREKERAKREKLVAKARRRSTTRNASRRAESLGAERAEIEKRIEAETADG